MELKSVVIIKPLRAILSSNCTFMELKFKHRDQIALLNIVLIVPLWN